MKIRSFQEQTDDYYTWINRIQLGKGFDHSNFYFFAWMLCKLDLLEEVRK